MACYDCEDCNKHINNGGKCNKFEYDCPYDLIRFSNVKDVNKINDKALQIEKLLKEIDDLDIEGNLSECIASINNDLVDIIDYSKINTIMEWEEIK